jgi:hypothetical protein
MKCILQNMSYTHQTVDDENFTNTILSLICFRDEKEETRAALKL